LKQLNNWIEAFRLRTLFLALSSVILGGLLPLVSGRFNPSVFILTLTTALLLQILSNLANDYGDAEKGTDNPNRLGPARTVQSGKISKAEMKRLIAVVASLSLISGLALLFSAFGLSHPVQLITFLVLGLAAIGAAILYTVGNRAYGYKGLGDGYVFLFFGIVGVYGSWYLQTLRLDVDILLPAATIGFFSTGVLNLNNMRDEENDRNHGKRTIPVRIGLKKAKLYHWALITSGWICAVIYIALQSPKPLHLILISAAILFIRHLMSVQKKSGAALDPHLKELSMATFAFSVLFVLAFLISG
jgi:1,4-dihydroxy-2-naphthoate polyprenyltransferase